MTQTSDWSALFTPEDGANDLTTAQLTALKNNYQLNVVHNPAGEEKLQTKDGNNFVRTVPGKQQDDGQKIYDLLTADAGYGEKVKFVLDHMDWQKSGMDYHKRLAFQSLNGRDFAAQEGIVYVKPGGSDAETKEWALDGLRLWAFQGSVYRDDKRSYFAHIARNYAKHLFWEGSDFDQKPANPDPNAAVISAGQTWDFLYLFSDRWTGTDGMLPVKAGPTGRLVARCVMTMYMWIFSDRTALDKPQATVAQVNIPAQLGMHNDYWESETQGVHQWQTPPVLPDAAGRFPADDQLHHFAGYLWLGASLGGVARWCSW